MDFFVILVIFLLLIAIAFLIVSYFMGTNNLYAFITFLTIFTTIAAYYYTLLEPKKQDIIKTQIPVVSKIYNKIVDTTILDNKNINNKKKIYLESEIKIGNEKLFKYKHETLLDNLKNSIKQCIDENNFYLADLITKYKNIYIKIYTLRNNILEESKNNNIVPVYNSNNDYLILSQELDELDKTIQKAV